MAGRSLPDYVVEEFDAYLKCGRMDESFLRLRCEQCHAGKLMGSRGTSLCRALRADFGRANRQSCRFVSCKKRGFCPSCGARRTAETAALLATGNTGAVTLIQRFGSALNLNVHFHMIFVDGVYPADVAELPVFRHVPSPDTAELQAVVQNIAERIGRLLEKRGLIERDRENAWLSGDMAQAGPLDDLVGHSTTYRTAVGPRAGQKVFTLQTVPAQGAGEGRSAAQAGGFSLHAGLDIQPGQPGVPRVWWTRDSIRVAPERAFRRKCNCRGVQCRRTTS